MMRINKYISRSGIASRRNAEKLIIDGLVKVNGNIVTELSFQINEGDVVEYNNKIIEPIEEMYYFALNKPVDYASTNSKKFDDHIIFDLIDIKTKLFSIGRLDKDSRGLIIITNDGDIYNKVIHPRSIIFKKYIVKVDKFFVKNHKQILENGIDIGGYITSPAKIKILDDRTIQIEISEGKNRQIRRMLAILGYKVLDLNRISIGEVKLSNLEIGKYRSLTTKEINYLRNL